MVRMARIAVEVQELVVVEVPEALATHIDYRKLKYRIEVCIFIFTTFQNFQALRAKSLRAS